MLTHQTHDKHDVPALARALGELSEGQQESPGFAPAAMLCSVLEHIGGGRIETIAFDGDTRFAIALRSRSAPLPIDESWITPLTSSGLPVVADPGAVTEFARTRPRPLILREIPMASQFHTQLMEAGVPVRTLSVWQRASLDTTIAFADWMNANFDHKRRKELKRLRARLTEQGTVTFERLAATDTLEPFVQDFLHLESSGWKARRGTALAQNMAHEKTLRDGLATLHRQDKLRFWRIVHNGKPIAALFAIVENGQATLGKIAYDEAFSKYSPGVLLILDATEDFCTDSAITLADSNAVPDHPMINRIWRGRMDIADLMVFPPHMGTITIAIYLAAERTRLKLRSLAKLALNQLKRKKS